MYEPSALISSLITAVAGKKTASAGMRAVTECRREFPNRLAAMLTGIVLDPQGRELADRFLDRYWADEDRGWQTLNATPTDAEVIIGSGYHAAVYAAVRVLSGHPRPLVLERGPRAGGTFAQTTRPTFYLNSRNRPGLAGVAGDQGASLNYLPGAPIQPSAVSMAEYQTNTDMALVIRLALAQFADVVTGANVQSVYRDETRVAIDVEDHDSLIVGRLIDARGLGEPLDQGQANGTTILTFPQLLQRMDQPWPLRGLRRVAVVGGGDAGKCTVEALLGAGPQPFMAAAALDWVERVDWYSDQLPTSCDAWQQQIRGRYQAIGRYLRPDRLGARRLTVLPRRARPVALPEAALIDGRSYDLVVLCTGNEETRINGLNIGYFDLYTIADDEVVARYHDELPAYRVGPHARLPFTDQEVEDGIADLPDNAVSMFRTGGKTAALAATLGPVTPD